MEGLDSVNHLNNILSTDIRDLDKGMRIDGLICDSNGRVADIVNCYHMGKSILIVGIDSNSESTRELLTKGVPWDKKLSLLDGNGALEHLRIMGQDPSSLVERLYPELSKLSENTYSEFENVVFSLGTHNEHEIIDVIVRRDNSDFYERIESCNQKISKIEDWDFARIEVGYPGSNEVNTKYLPHDIGMINLISLNKGCYPGQEIHARLDSRSKPKKRMVVLSTNDFMDIGKHSLSDGNSVQITSIAVRDGLHLSMGICSIDVSSDATLVNHHLESKLTLL
tara:strand:- start:6842 stop:7684 length:843 start_codon:yes stop_codon:yes gene_type:complete